MNIVICDDEQVYTNAAIDALRQWALFRNCSQAIMTRSFSSTEDLLEAWRGGMHIDLLFLDIQIPGEMNGLELAKLVRQENDQMIIVFITNYGEYACEGYFVNALRYIKKPILYSQIAECMEIAYHRWSLMQASSAIFNVGKQTVILPYHDIMYIEIRGHNLMIHSIRDSTILELRGKMTDVATILPKELFIQCHRSFIANLMYVRRLTKTMITMADMTEIPLGRKYVKNMESGFDCYYQGMKL